MKSPLSAFVLVVLGLISCRKNEYFLIRNPSMTIREEIYGNLPDGTGVKVYTLDNGKGMKVKVMEYGATLVSVEAPDRDGVPAEMTHGFDTFADWLGNRSYFGSTVGRFGNRIAGAKFTLDGKEHTLAANNEPGGVPCSLHGGRKGFDKVLWKGRQVEGGVEFTYLSKDGEEGYPGNLEVKVTYQLNTLNQLTWSVNATTDASTVVNVVQHAYWNLSGDPAVPVTDHELVLHADRFLPTTEGMIPTGELAPVAGTPMDFTRPEPIGKRIGADFEPLKIAGGYDHAWILNGSGLRPAALLKDPKSGRKMAVATDAPAVHVYTGNFLNGSVKGRNGAAYHKRTAVCLETEAYPDAPNQPAFPSAVLRPGEVYQHTTVFEFSAE